MIALLLALAQAAAASSAGAVDGTPLGVLPKQTLPASGCAAYLWSAGEPHRLVAMASADDRRLRIVLDGRTTDLSRAGPAGAEGFGLAGETTYRTGGVSATLDLTIGNSLTRGAAVKQATLRLDRPGADGVVLSVAGLIGCAA